MHMIEIDLIYTSRTLNVRLPKMFKTYSISILSEKSSIHVNMHVRCKGTHTHTHTHIYTQINRTLNNAHFKSVC